MKTLFPYQRKALAAIRAAVATGTALMVMATGLGKTVVAAAFARWWLKHKRTSILFLVHLDDAIKQAAREFHETLGPDVRLQYLNEDGKLDPDASVVFCTFQTMHNRRRKIPRNAFGLVIVDEGHRSMAATYKPTIEHFRAAFRFAMTATPDRMDGLDIRDLFGEPVFDFPLARALAEGALADVDYQVLLADVNQEALSEALTRIKAGDRRVTRDQIDRTVFLAEKLEATVERIREAQKTRCKTVIFCQNKRHARAVASFFPEARLYDSGIPKRELEERLPAFRAGRVRTLITVDKLNEAVDVPDVDHLVFMRQTGSARIWLQQLGRGLRKSPGKTDVLVQDFVANCDRLYQVAKLGKDIGGYAPKNRAIHGGIHTTGLDFTFSKEARDLLDVLGKMENVPQAGPDGTFEIDGEKWGTILVISRLTGLGAKVIKVRISACRKQNGKLMGGQPHTFYHLSDVKKACEDLLRPLPQAGKDGTFKADGETWGTVGAWARILSLGTRYMSLRLSSSSCQQRKGKDPYKRVKIFYTRSDVEKAGEDLLRPLPQAGKNGMFTADEETWGTLYSLAEHLHISTPTISSRITSSRNRYGRDRGGRTVIFYALSDVKKACEDLLRPLPQAGKDGAFEIDGETWGNLRFLSLTLLLSKDVLKTRIKECRNQQGKTTVGQITIFYALSDVKKACEDLLRPLPQAGKDGTFEIDGETWGTTEALSKMLPAISRSLIQKKISGYRSMLGKDKRNRLAMFYVLSDVKKACEDLLQPLPQAGKDGTFKADGETWGTVGALAALFKISESAVASHASSGRTRKGKNRSNRIMVFYALSDVKKACADLLKPLPQAGKNGTFTADEETWGTAIVLGRMLGIPESTILRRTATLRTRPGKNASGSVCTFYALSDVKKACASVLAKKKRKK